VFWDRESLASSKGEKPAKFDGNNDETFNNFDEKSWTHRDAARAVLTEWEKAVEAATQKKSQSGLSTIAHVGAHQRLSHRQMVYVRKLQGVWDRLRV